MHMTIYVLFLHKNESEAKAPLKPFPLTGGPEMREKKKTVPGCPLPMLFTPDRIPEGRKFLNGTGATLIL